MIYIFDTNSISHLKFFFPTIFQSIWDGLAQMVQDGTFISTREVWNELQGWSRDEHPIPWLKAHKALFTTPLNEELRFVAQILKEKRFQGLIEEKQRLKGTPVADPFVIACAKVRGGTVVTEEKWKPNSHKIPNICKHFDIPVTNLEGFMEQQQWRF